MKQRKNLFMLVIFSFIFSFIYPSWVVVTEANTIGYQDPFEYTEDNVSGSEYISHGTYLYNDKNDNKNIQNFNFTSPYDSRIDAVTGATVPKTSQIINGKPFDGGYHEYRDETKQASVFTKKIVKPTTDPNKFDIQLDVISGKKETKEKIDIAFVFDKSTSMNEKTNVVDYDSPKWDWWGNPSYDRKTRWTILKESFNGFSKQFLNSEYDVQFGLSSFGSIGNSAPFYEVNRFSNGSYFTNQINSLINNPIYSEKPGASSGTPTFIGVDIGLELLSNLEKGVRPDSKKFLIFITDGEPTFDSTDAYRGIDDYSYEERNNRLNNVEQFQLHLNKERHPYDNRWYQSAKKYEGNGASQSTNYARLLSNVRSKYQEPKYKEIKKFSIGIDEKAANYKNVLEVLGETGDYKVPKGNQTNMEKDLKDVFSKIESQIKDSVSSISNGVLVDEMSDFVTLDKGSLKRYQLKLSNGDLKSTEVLSNNVDQYAKNVKVTPADNKIEATNITLSGDQHVSNGYRITYQVELKPEFRNGNFYPANKPTFLYDANNPNGIGFAVPSIKNNIRNIPVEKNWIGNQSIKPPITLELYANGSLSDKITLNNGKTQTEFKDKPVLDNEGKTIDYKVKETINYEVINNVKYTSTVSGNMMDGFIVTNTPVADFETSKTASKTDLKPRETFTYNIEVWNTVNGSELNNIQVTDIMPDGVEIVGNLKLNNQQAGTFTKRSLDILIPKLTGDEKAVITVDVKVKDDAIEGVKKNTATVKPEKPQEPKYPTIDVNVNRESHIILKKTDLDGKIIDSAATFELIEIENGKEKIINTLKTDRNGIISFNGVKTGTYCISEIDAPENYDRLEKPIELVLSNKGELTLKESLSGMVELKQIDGISQFELLVKNKETPPKPGILPETGGYGHGKYMLFASVCLGISILLAVYFIVQRRKGWR